MAEEAHSSLPVDVSKKTKIWDTAVIGDKMLRVNQAPSSGGRSLYSRLITFGK